MQPHRLCVVHKDPSTALLSMLCALFCLNSPPFPLSQTAILRQEVCELLGSQGKTADLHKSVWGWGGEGRGDCSSHLFLPPSACLCCALGHPRQLMRAYNIILKWEEREKKNTFCYVTSVCPLEVSIWCLGADPQISAVLMHRSTLV